ncbi:MAG: DUF805 domain-containing protein [Pseudomonadota bacterium]
MTDTQSTTLSPMRWLDTLFNPVGTSSKLDFTRAWTLLFFIQVSVVVIIPFVAGVVALVGGTADALSTFALYASPIVFIVTTLSSYIIHTRRLRDASKPTWLAVLILVPLFVGCFLFYQGMTSKSEAYETAYQERAEYLKNPDAFEAIKERERAEATEKARERALKRCEAQRAKAGEDAEFEETCETQVENERRSGSGGWDNQSEPEYRSPTPSKTTYILEPNLAAIQNAVIPLSLFLAIWSLMWVARVPLGYRAESGEIIEKPKRPKTPWVPLPQALFSFEGRMRRLQYILYVVAFTLLSVLVQALLLYLIPGGLQGPVGSGIANQVELYGIILPMAVLGMWIGWSMATKRLHDTGRGIKWLVPFILLSIISMPFTFMVATDPTLTQTITTQLPAWGTALLVIVSLINVALFLYLLFRPSEKTSNEYGLGPQNENVALAF